MVFFSLGCASTSNLIRDRDYDSSMSLARQSFYQKSLDNFPQREAGGFITTIEKNWLRFWVNQSNAKELEDQVKSFDSRKFLSVSREAKYFFFQEDEEGYVPAEHEVIIMHLLAAMVELQQGHFEDAKVEARRAGYFLQGFFNETQPHFDSPGLRVWLAAIWSAMGEWQEAQVDLRRAGEVTGDKSLSELANKQRAPENLNVVFSGVGPTLDWSNQSYEPQFVVEPSPFENQGKLNLDPRLSRAYSSHDWYVRHAERNTAIRDILMRSRYMSQFIGVESSALSKRAGGKMVTGSIKAFGIGLGVAIVGAGVYVLANILSGGGEKVAELIFAAGLGVGSFFWSESDRLDRRMRESIDQSERSDLESLRTYRFVRFLPDHVILNWQTKAAQIPLATTIDFQSPQSKTKVRFIHAP